MITIKELAQILKVSQSTVSKALNDKSDVSSKLKRKIKKKASELGYKPNPNARKLAQNRTYTIGVFMLSRSVLSLKENFAFQFVAGIIEEANNHDFDILFFTITKADVEDKSYIELCRERHIEGAVIIGLTLDDIYISDIENSEIPVAVIDQNVKGENICFVSSDNRMGIRSALDYLLNMGHKKIMYIHVGSVSEVSNVRKSAYIEYMEEHNLFSSDLLLEGDYSKKKCVVVANKIVNMDCKPTAIFAANDVMAITIIKVFKQNGIEVPKDISVVGFDNFIISEFSEPELTTVSQDVNGVGREAVMYIIDTINNQKTSQVKMINTELIIRDSVKKIN